jgi:hypothetical protein
VFTNYNDNNAFSTYYYQITVRKASPCFPTSETKEVGGPYSQSVSNMEDNLFENINENSLVFPVVAAPNPAADFVNIQFGKGGNGKYKLELTDITGKVVLSKDNIATGNYTLNRGELPSGMYTVTLSGEKIFRGKVIFR